MASTWGNNTWGANTWQSEVVAVSLTGLSITSELGDESAFNVEGWGRQTWGNSGWGVEYSVEPSGLSITSSVGSVTASQLIPVDVAMPQQMDALQGSATADAETIVSPTGFSITSSPIAASTSISGASLIGSDGAGL